MPKTAARIRAFVSIIFYILPLFAATYAFSISATAWAAWAPYCASICFKESDARLIGRTARGVRAIQLAEGDYVVGFAVALEDTRLLTVSETGYGRKSNFDDYRVQSRAGATSLL